MIVLLMQSLETLADHIQQLAMAPQRSPTYQMPSGISSQAGRDVPAQGLHEQEAGRSGLHGQPLETSPGTAGQHSNGRNMVLELSDNIYQPDNLSSRLAMGMCAASDDEGSDHGRAKDWEACSLTSDGSDAFLDGLLIRIGAHSPPDDDSPRYAPVSSLYLMLCWSGFYHEQHAVAQLRLLSMTNSLRI